MKKRMPLFVLLICVFLSTCYTANALLKEKEEILITQEQVDVTGDSIKDLVVLKGNKSPRSQIYFENLILYITDSKTHKIMRLPLDIGGYEPSFSFGDVNGDGVADVLVSAATGGSGGAYDYALVTVKGKQMKKMPVPQPLEVSGEFKDGYKAEIKVGNQEPFILDLRDREKIYDELGVYQDGKLLKKVEVMVDPFGDLRMVDSDHDGVYELQGTQRVSGFAHYDGILDVISTWKWEGDHWNLKKTALHPLK